MHGTAVPSKSQQAIEWGHVWPQVRGLRCGPSLHWIISLTVEARRLHVGHSVGAGILWWRAALTVQEKTPPPDPSPMCVFRYPLPRNFQRFIATSWRPGLGPRHGLAVSSPCWFPLCHVNGLNIYRVDNVGSQPGPSPPLPAPLGTQSLNRVRPTVASLLPGPEEDRPGLCSGLWPCTHRETYQHLLSQPSPGAYNAPGQALETGAQTF